MSRPLKITGDWYAAGRFHDHKNHRIFFRDNKRSAPALLLLHGFPTSSWDWYKIWPLLENDYRLVAPDFLGFGFSSKPYPYPYSIIDQADHVEALLSSLGITACYIIAHDYAVSVVQEMLWRRLDPEYAQGPPLHKVVLLNGGLFPETHRARPIQKLLLGRWGRLVNLFLTKKSLHKNLVRVFGPQTPPTDREIDGFWEAINYNNGKRCFHLLIRYMNDRVANRENWLKALQQTSTPIRLINGPEDPVSGIHMVRRYKELIPNPDVEILDMIGHYPNVEAPEAVARIAIEYFNTPQQSHP